MRMRMRTRTRTSVGENDQQQLQASWRCDDILRKRGLGVIRADVLVSTGRTSRLMSASISSGCTAIRWRCATVGQAW